MKSSKHTGKAVLIAGGINTDLSFRPFAPLIRGTSNPGTISISAGGVARNIAAILAGLGVPVHLLGVVGTDPLSRTVLLETQGAGVETALVRSIAGVQCGIYVSLDVDGDLELALSDLSGTERFTPELFQETVVPLEPAAEIGLLVLECNLPAETLQAAITWAEERSILVVLDPVSVAKAQRLRGLKGTVAVITPNEGEAELLESLAPGSLPQIERWLITRGSRGVTVRLGTSRRDYAVRPLQPVNANGAGDAFVAGLVRTLFAVADSDGWGAVDWNAAVLSGIAAAEYALMVETTVPVDLTAERHDEIISRLVREQQRSAENE